MSYVTFKEKVKYGHIRQVGAKYRFNWYEMPCEGKWKLRWHNTSYCLIEVVTKAAFTVLKICVDNKVHNH
jgi:hypothetical protein